MNTLIKVNPINDIKIGDKIKFRFDFNYFNFITPMLDPVLFYKNDTESKKEQEKMMKWLEDFKNKFPGNYQSLDLSKYNNRTLSAKVNSFSRIDKYPILEVDFDLSKIRDEKINEILK